MGQTTESENAQYLLGETVILQPLDASMTDELLAALLESKPELLRFMSWDCWSRDEAAAFIARTERERAEGTGRQFVIRRKTDHALAGVIGLMNFDPYTPKAAVGYWVRSSMCGNGYATDALCTLLKFCQHELKLQRIDSSAAETNPASQKVLMNGGFQREGYKRKGQLCHGHWLDMVHFGKLLG